MYITIAASKEFLDPIIRTNHPDYISTESKLLDSGSYYDYQNNTSLHNMVPSWIIQQDDETDDDPSGCRAQRRIHAVYNTHLTLPTNREV